ncbi:hypothetical protein LguiB_031615 [Lonicera macranthoides]
MDSTARRRSSGGILEGLYRVVMRRNSVYVTFVVAGALLGERAVDYGVHRLWEHNNVGVELFVSLLSNAIHRNSGIDGTILEMWARNSYLGDGGWSMEAKRYEDISVLGQRQSE